MGLRPVPAPEGAQLAVGGHALRRRAADAGRGPRAHEPPEAADDGRAVAGPCAAGGAGTSSTSSGSINQQGVTVLLIEQNANMALKLADRAYVLETGLHHQDRHRRGAAGGRVDQGGLPRQEEGSLKRRIMYVKMAHTFGCASFFCGAGCCVRLEIGGGIGLFCLRRHTFCRQRQKVCRRRHRQAHSNCQFFSKTKIPFSLPPRINPPPRVQTTGTHRYSQTDPTQEEPDLWSKISSTPMISPARSCST